MIASVTSEAARYRALAEQAMARLDDAQFAAPFGDDRVSVAMYATHVGGNLRSRFTDFLTSDGEKPWRERDREFAGGRDRAAILALWQTGWQALESTLAALHESDLDRTVHIRAQPLGVRDALARALAHTAYHVGQIVLLAKLSVGESWSSLSVPRGGSTAYNLHPDRERHP
jgi:hypothetical protein